MTGSEGTRLCRLRGAVGQAEPCPGAACPFWDTGASFDGGCALDELDLAGRASVAELLLQIRGDLETAGEAAAREELYRLLSTGDADGG